MAVHRLLPLKPNKNGQCSALFILIWYTRQDIALWVPPLALKRKCLPALSFRPLALPNLLLSQNTVLTLRQTMKKPDKCPALSWYARQDSNLRPLGSKPSTLIH